MDNISLKHCLKLKFCFSLYYSMIISKFTNSYLSNNYDVRGKGPYGGGGRLRHVVKLSLVPRAKFLYILESFM